MEKELHNPELERKRPRRAADVASVFFYLSVPPAWGATVYPEFTPLRAGQLQVPYPRLAFPQVDLETADLAISLV